MGCKILYKNIFLTPKETGWYYIEIDHKIELQKNGFVIAVEWSKDQEVKKYEIKQKEGYLRMEF